VIEGSPVMLKSLIGRFRGARLLWLAAAAFAVVGLSRWIIEMRSIKRAQIHTKHRFDFIMFGLIGYDHGFGHLPFAIDPVLVWTGERRQGDSRDLARRCSWRLTIVSCMWSLTEWKGPWDESQPWDSPANAALSQMSPIFSYEAQLRSDSNQAGEERQFPATNALAITGPGTAFGDGTEKPASLAQIPSSVIIVVESRASGVPWPAPGDFDIRSMPETICSPDGKGISGADPSGFHVVFGDKQVWFLSNRTPFANLKKFFTIAGAKENDRELLLGPYVLDREQ
jgi:hypothetical protein